MGGNSSRHMDRQYSRRNYPGQGGSSRFDPHYVHPAQQQLNRDRLRRRYEIIQDDYRTLEQVTEALAEAGLESSNLIVGIDFTKSNEWSGKLSFNRRSLHDLVHSPNPYEHAITIIGRTLSKFDEDDLIPCYGFGDASTHDKDVFSFYPDNRPCNGFEEALRRYRELVPHVKLAGPTSFAPIIETAISIVDESGGQYHVLLVIADGQVTRSVDTADGVFSTQERETVDAIVKASGYPLSIVLVGVGDGPWDMMHKFDDYVPARAFDNFQFVNFTEMMGRSNSNATKEAQFALAALMEIPSQYKATLDLQLLGNRRGNSGRVSLPPPIRGGAPVQRSFSSSTQYVNTRTVPTWASEDQLCSLCSFRRKDLAFMCGHQTCINCGNNLRNCHVCGLHIQEKIRLY